MRRANPLIVGAHAPIVYARHVGTADAASIVRLATALRASTALGPRVLVYDSGQSPGAWLDRDARRAVREWLREPGCVAVEIASASPVVRAAFAVLLRVSRPAIAWRTHTTLRSAVRSALARVGSTLDPDAIVRDLAERPSV